MEARNRPESLRLSASRFSKEKPLIRPSACQISATWPAVRMQRTGLPRASTAMLMFVLGPPRERPIASSSLPPFWRRLQLVCPPNGGIDDQVFEIRILAQQCKKPSPDAFFPSPETTKSVQRVAQSPLNETARAVGCCGKWRRGYQAPDLRATNWRLCLSARVVALPAHSPLPRQRQNNLRSGARL